MGVLEAVLLQSKVCRYAFRWQRPPGTTEHEGRGAVAVDKRPGMWAVISRETIGSEPGARPGC